MRCAPPLSSFPASQVLALATVALMRDADVAMYSAKAKGKNRIEHYDAGKLVRLSKLKGKWVVLTFYAEDDTPLVVLAGKEYELLLKLMTDPTRVFTKEHLLREVWDFRSLGRTRTLDSHASRLRRKLAAAGRGVFVLNVWGVGYRLLDR